MSENKLLLIALITALMSLELNAQDRSPPRGESRLPKGIPGLEAGQAQPPSPNWLLDAKDDTERFRRIQIYAGGTHEQMWQVGYRYEQIYQAIIDENWALGEHHWGKLRDVLNVALMKRPNRTPNAEAILLDSTWQPLYDALKAENVKQARQAFLAARGSCMACHISERMEFLNNTPIFRDTADFPSQRQ